jgi:hypothetical protein
MKTINQIRNNRLQIIFLLFLCLSILFLVNPVKGAQTLNSSVVFTSATEHSITWNITYKTDVRTTGATFDGVEIEGYDLNHNIFYTAKELEANTTHTFCIYKDLINCDTAKTLPLKEEWFVNIIYTYGLFILGCVIVLVGTQIPFVSFVSMPLAVIGISLNSGDLNLNIAYFLLIGASAFVGLGRLKEG